MKNYSGGNQIEEARNPCNYITHIIKLFYDVLTDEFLFLMMSQKKKYLKSDVQVMIGLMRILLGTMNKLCLLNIILNSTNLQIDI